MVLFLFIIMLLDFDQREDLRTRTIPSMAAIAGLGLLLVMFLSFFKGKFEGPLEKVAEPAVAQADSKIDIHAKPPALPYSTRSRDFGYGLFTRYMLPFQVTGVLLLVAMVGVIVLSLRYEPDREEENPQ